jgi:hypothetical protein
MQPPWAVVVDQPNRRGIQLLVFLKKTKMINHTTLQWHACHTRFLKKTECIPYVC